MKCIDPFYINEIPVGCGKCAYCLNRKVSDWSFRLLQEERISTSSCFITLTYNTDSVPITNRGFMTLKKKDLQDFIKRLRENIWRKYGKRDIKYYAVGEYGGKKGRPHYHLILFNVEDMNMVIKSWDNGEVHFGKVEIGSIRYVVKYLDKMQGYKNKSAKWKHQEQEFSTMSKSLGRNYLSEAIVKYHKENLDKQYVIVDEIKMPLPRYYKKIIYDERELKQIQRFARKADIEQTEKTRIEEELEKVDMIEFNHNKNIYKNEKYNKQRKRKEIL